MNRILMLLIIVGGLSLLEIPQAAAHPEVRNQHRSQAPGHSRAYDRDADFARGYRRGYQGHRYASKFRRSGKMPRWLRRDYSFKRWYEHSHLRADGRVSWNRLFDIYLYERNDYRYRHY